ncbi:MAG: YbbR-like domain-containing protein [Prevotella sp.]|nr:YbbR-like domain-containing protein [Prevotella sp.]
MESSRIFSIIRNFLFSKGNREFLIFLFFLALSGIFWLGMALNEDYEREVAVPLRILNMPKEIMLTSDETDTVKMTVRDKGIVILAYLYGKGIKPIDINFKLYDRGNGTGMVSGAELQKLATRNFVSSTKITGSSTGKYEFFYNTGARKRVPVRWSGRVIPENLYFISHVEYWPDSVTVFASEEKLDSIKTVYTEQLNYVNFRDTLTVECKMRKTEGVKIIPDRIKVGFYTDVLTEESIDGIPVQGINMPEGKVLRTFPAKVSVRFVTGASVYRTLKASDFTVVANYNELMENPSEKCTIYLQQMPNGISKAQLLTKQVDYLIEEPPTTTQQ